MRAAVGFQEWMAQNVGLLFTFSAHSSRKLMLEMRGMTVAAPLAN